MDHDRYDDAYIAHILRQTKRIAVVGASANEERASNYVARFLAGVGYDVIPINPGHAGKEIAGRLTYARLADIPGPIDMVDVFRRSEDVPSVVEEALRLDPLPKVIWMQLGIRNDEAAAKAEAAGIEVVMDRCPKIEYPRLLGGSRR